MLFGSNANPSSFHMRRRRDGEDEDDVEVSAKVDYEGDVEDASAEYEYVGTSFFIVAVSRTFCLGLTRRG